MRLTILGRFSTFAVTAASLALPAIAWTQTQPAPAAKASLPAATAVKSTTATGAHAAMAEKPSSLPKKPGQDGLTMHGHWTIDLKNPDGTIAEHREFENSLMNPSYLLAIVTGQNVPGDLGITIASTGSSVCTAANAGMPGPLGSCLVAASATAGLGGNTCFAVAAGVCNYNLKEFADLSNTGSGAITLSGYIPVLANGTVTGVGTQIMTCIGGIGLTTADPVSCYNQTGATAFYYGPLTGTSITALPVTVGQTISLSVVLSFS